MSQTMKQPLVVSCHCGDESVHDGNWLSVNRSYHCNNGHTDPIPNRNKILKALRAQEKQEVKMKRNLIRKGATLKEVNDAAREIINKYEAEAEEELARRDAQK